MIRPTFRWALLAVACVWFLTTAAQAAQAAPVPEWVGIALTVTLTGLVPVGWYGVSLYRGHAAELEALRLRVSLLEQLVERVVRLDNGEMYFTVVPDGVNANAPINDSHRCPPSCP